MTARKVGHIVRVTDRDNAKGGLVTVLCGRRIQPLPEDQASALPTCARCTKAANAEPWGPANDVHFTWLRIDTEDSP